MNISGNAWCEMLDKISDNEYTNVHLDIKGQNISLTSLRRLVEALESNQHIKSLDLSENNLGDNAARILATNKTLTHLDLSYNDLGTPLKSFLRIMNPDLQAIPYCRFLSFL